VRRPIYTYTMVKRFATLARRSVDKFLGSIRVRFPNVPAADVRKKARICDTVLQAQVEASTSPDRYITLEQRYTTKSILMEFRALI